MAAAATLDITRRYRTYCVPDTAHDRNTAQYEFSYTDNSRGFATVIINFALVALLLRFVRHVLYVLGRIA